MWTSVTSVRPYFDKMLMLASHLHSRMTESHKQIALMNLGSICGPPYTS